MAAVLPHSFKQARLSHDFFHQNASSLHKQFALPQGQATTHVHACPDCQCITPAPLCAGVNPRGLRADELQDCSIQHGTGIPHSSTAQAIVKSVHGTLRAMLNKEKKGESHGQCYPTGTVRQSIICT